MKLSRTTAALAHVDFGLAVKEALLRLERTVESFVRGQRGNGHALD